MRVVWLATCLALLPAFAGAQNLPADPQAWLALASSGKLGEVRELMLWDSIRNERDPAAFEDYLRSYPDGTFARIAKLRVEALRGEPTLGRATPASEGTTAANAIVAYPLSPAVAPDAGGDRPGGQRADGQRADDQRADDQRAGGAGAGGDPAVATSRLPDGASVEAYDRAFGVLRAAEYDEAAAMLRGFVDSYPADPLVANAQYWLGEIYMVRGDYARAAASFGDVLRVQLGTALARGGHERDACGAFARLGREHPAATARYGVTLIAERRRLGC
jgi:tetratricopeptide (TPR) repeat protein